MVASVLAWIARTVRPVFESYQQTTVVPISQQVTGVAHASSLRRRGIKHTDRLQVARGGLLKSPEGAADCANGRVGVVLARLDGISHLELVHDGGGHGQRRHEEEAEELHFETSIGSWDGQVRDSVPCLAALGCWSLLVNIN